jgi:protoporphyrinogen oxidase
MAGVPWQSARSAPAEPTLFVSVAVIGGGVAGLAAAGALASSSSLSSKDRKTILLLEARDELGGRVRQLHGLAPWPVEMGPEFVHGERSPVVVRRVSPFFF